MSFENIIGNEKIKNELLNSIHSNSISHSYIFSGQSGIGKKLIALEFAKMILCLNKEEKPCNKCKFCIEILNGNNPDFNIISSEGKIKIETIRNLIQKVYEKPIISNKKVYIIDNADSMTIEAQNCLLKTLEEPPEYIVLILITSNESNIINTIKSRCLKLSFNPINNKDLKDYLQNNLGYKDLTDQDINKYEGSIGKAISVKEKEDLYYNINVMLENLQKSSIITILNNETEIYKQKENINEILDYFNIYFLQKAKEDYNLASKYLRAIEIVEETKNRLYFNSNYDMTIDNLLINIWEELNS